MITLRNFREKVDASQKASVLTDDRIQVGGEFEVELLDSEEEDAFPSLGEFAKDVPLIEELRDGDTLLYTDADSPDLGDFDHLDEYERWIDEEAIEGFLTKVDVYFDDYAIRWDEDVDNIFIVIQENDEVSFYNRLGHKLEKAFNVYASEYEEKSINEVALDRIFREIEIEYEQRRNSQQEQEEDSTNKFQEWYPEFEVVDDASLVDGIEIVTPPVSIKKFLDYMGEIFDDIQNRGVFRTDRTTGLHINISIDGVDLREDLDVLKLALFVEEGRVYKFFSGRRGSKYAQSIRTLLSNPEDIEEIDSEMQQKLKQKMHQSWGKHFGVNFLKIPENYIEFRYLGGKGYEEKFDEIRSQMLDFAYFLRISTDPNAHWKEYQKKLFRLLTSMDDE